MQESSRHRARLGVRDPFYFSIAALIILSSAASCDEVPPDVPCELVESHLNGLVESSLPGGVSGETRVAYADALAHASRTTACEDLTLAQRSCQVAATSLAATRACAPATPPDRPVMATRDDGLPSDHPRPALPTPAFQPSSAE